MATVGMQRAERGHIVIGTPFTIGILAIKGQNQLLSHKQHGLVS